MSLQQLKVVLFYGSTRAGRMVERVGNYVKGVVEAKGHEPIVLDPLELPLEMMKTPLHFYPDPADAPDWMHDVNEKLKAADGFIIISSEYNGGLPAALTNMIDHFPLSSYRHRPVGIISYSMGQFGGIRSQVHGISYANEIGMVVIPSRVVVPVVQKAFEEDGTCTEDRIIRNVEQLVSELQWYASAIKNQTELEPPPIKPKEY